jgi:hypothetical protein
MDRKENPSVAAFRTRDERFATIGDLAYRLWEDRGRPAGSPDDDWYMAELIVDRAEDRDGGKEEALDTLPGQKRLKPKQDHPTFDIATTDANDRTGKRRARRAMSSAEK